MVFARLEVVRLEESEEMRDPALVLPSVPTPGFYVLLVKDVPLISYFEDLFLVLAGGFGQISEHAALRVWFYRAKRYFLLDVLVGPVLRNEEVLSPYVKLVRPDKPCTGVDHGALLLIAPVSAMVQGSQ